MRKYPIKRETSQKEQGPQTEPCIHNLDLTYKCKQLLLIHSEYKLQISDTVFHRSYCCCCRVTSALHSIYSHTLTFLDCFFTLFREVKSRQKGSSLHTALPLLHPQPEIRICPSFQRPCPLPRCERGICACMCSVVQLFRTP